MADELPRPGRSRWSRTVDGRFAPPPASQTYEWARGTGWASPPGGIETILLVEDEAELLEAARAGLERLGYVVGVADSADEALRYVRAGGELDLLLTDVVLPGMNGVALAQRVADHRPRVRILFMSGYTSEACVQSGTLSTAPRGFIGKPFNLGMLAHAVRNVLDRAD